MSKEYFSHDYNTRNKKKLAALIHYEKMKGYGLFWVIVEMLHEDSCKWMDLDEVTYIAIKNESGCDIKYIKTFVEKCISTYKVFIKEGSRFTTDRVLRNIEKRDEIKQKRSFAGKLSAEKRKQKSTHAEHMLNTSEHVSNKTQQRKVKESKVNTTTKVVVVQADPFFEMFRRAAGAHISDDELMAEVGKFKNKYPNVHINQAGALVNTWVSNIGREKPQEKKMVL